MLSFLFAVAQAAVLSQTVGSVGDQILTSRQVALSGLMDRVLAGEKDSGPVGLSTKAGEKEKATLLLEIAVAQESAQFSLNDAKAGDVDSLSEKTRKVLADAAWKKLEFSEKEVKALAAQKLAGKALIQLKTETMRGVISDTEAQTYFEKNRQKFGTLPFSSFKENIKGFLAQQQMQDRLRSWFEIVRRKHKVREFTEEEVVLPPPVKK